MMGKRRVMQEALFYGFSLERQVPDDYMLRRIDRFVDLSGVRAHLEPYYSDVGRRTPRPREFFNTIRPYWSVSRAIPSGCRDGDEANVTRPHVRG